MPSPSASPAGTPLPIGAGTLAWGLLGAVLVLVMVGVLVWRWQVGRKRWADAQQSARGPLGNESSMDIVEKGAPRSPARTLPPSEPH
ncbi:MAG: hypothetical protein ACYCW6_01030 [Candidatus Xenobia bacterium]